VIAAKTGPAWPESLPLLDQLAASVWLFEDDGRNICGRPLPSDAELDRVHAALEWVLLEQGARR